MQRQAGFSLVEAVVAATLVLVLLATALALTDPARSAAVVQPEAADMQQRLRVTADALYKDLVMVGAGAYLGSATGPLTNYFAPLLPNRALTNADPAGTAANDRITLLYVPATAAQTTLATAGPRVAAGSVGVNIDPGCPAAASACGLQTDMTALLFDASGLRDVFEVTGVTGNAVGLQSDSAALTFLSYPASTTKIVQATAVQYALKFDSVTRATQLVRSAGGGTDEPVVDHVVGLAFAFYGDPQPPRLTGKPLTDPVGPWTTYGPPPPPLGTQGPTRGYPPGENCAFAVDAVSGTQAPRLPGPTVANGEALAALTLSQLSDGPWCPDATNANRWDADLLRIRSVGVTIRVESAIAALRGPAGVLFANAGTAQNGSRWLVDLQMRFRIAPRNLNPR